MGCQDKQSSQKKEPKQETTKPNTTPLKKSNDVQLPLITQNTVVDFLTTYGKKHKENNAVISTRLGDIHIKLFNNTPLHRANFIFLVKQGYFNTTCFHRVVEDFIIQAGQSDKSDTRFLRKKIGNYKIPPEFTQQQHHKGAIASARRWNNNPKKLSDAYEFFIVHKQTGLHHLDQEHTVFGKVTKGLSVVDKIANEAIDKGEWPIHNIDISINVF